MNNKINLNYYTGNESEETIFFKLPKALMQNEIFNNLSNEAKILYTLLVDRVKLSKINNWSINGKLYVYFTREEASKQLNISVRTAVKVFKELEKDLIENVPQGLQKPNIIYVKNLAETSAEYSSTYKYSTAHHDEKQDEIYKLTAENKKLKETIKKLQAKLNSNTKLEKTEKTKKVENSIKENSTNNLTLAVQNFHPQECKNFTSSSEKNSSQEVKKMHPINNNSTNTNLIKNNSINQSNLQSDSNNLNNKNNIKIEKIGKGKEKKELKLNIKEIKEEIVTEITAEKTIPYEYLENDIKLEYAIKYLVEYDLNKELNTNNTNPTFYFSGLKIFISALTKMLSTKGNMQLNSMTVTYSKVYLKLQDFIEPNYKGNLSINSLTINAIKDYENGMAKNKINYPINYMCTCIWNALLYHDIKEWDLVKRG